MMEESPDTDAAKEQSETAELPLSILGGKEAAEGDVVRLKVVSVDSDNGTLTVAYASEPKMGGSEGMAREFDNQQPT